MSIVQAILQQAVDLNASDIHLKTDKPPFFRVHGDLIESTLPATSEDDLRCVVVDILPEHIKNKKEPDLEMDFSHFEPGVGRFRVNVFMSRNAPTLVFRYVKTKIGRAHV